MQNTYFRSTFIENDFRIDNFSELLQNKKQIEFIRTKQKYLLRTSLSNHRLENETVYSIHVIVFVRWSMTMTMMSHLELSYLLIEVSSIGPFEAQKEMVIKSFS